MNAVIEGAVFAAFLAGIYIFFKKIYEGVRQLVAKGVVGYAVIAFFVITPYIFGVVTFDADALNKASPYNVSDLQWISLVYFLSWTLFSILGATGAFDLLQKEKEKEKPTENRAV